MRILHEIVLYEVISYDERLKYLYRGSVITKVIKAYNTNSDCTLNVYHILKGGEYDLIDSVSK